VCQEDIFTGVTNVSCTMGVHRLDGKHGSGIMLKCTSCYEVVRDTDVTSFGGKDGKQPICSDCGLEMVPLCPEDHKCTCVESVHAGVKYCPACGDPICPGCGAHNVMVLSRVTGYMQDLAGWNTSKRQELKDRHRVDIGVGI
jgi:hypothetical protein